MNEDRVRSRSSPPQPAQTNYNQNQQTKSWMCDTRLVSGKNFMNSSNVTRIITKQIVWLIFFSRWKKRLGLFIFKLVVYDDLQSRFHKKLLQYQVHMPSPETERDDFLMLVVMAKVECSRRTNGRHTLKIKPSAKSRSVIPCNYITVVWTYEIA